MSLEGLLTGSGLDGDEEPASPYGQLERVQLEDGSVAYARPCFMQAVAEFEGQGFDRPFLLSEALCHQVAAGCRAQLIYFRAGNGSGELVNFLLMRDGMPVRFFPVGARSAEHVALAVIEDILPGSRLEVHLAAPEGVRGTAVVDVGLLEGG